MRSDPGEFWSGGSVIDLTSEEPTPAAPQPTGRSHSSELSSLWRRRAIAIAAVAIAVTLVLTDVLVGKVIHDQRQRHLAAELAEPVEKVPVGGAAMVLQIPSVGLNQVVVEGAGASQLRSGPGRLTSSAQPLAEKGATVILGRRSRYGGPFSLLGDVEKGDLIAIKTRSQEVRRYEVTGVRRTDAPVSVDSQTRLVLVTSASGRFGRRYLVVEARPETSGTEAAGATPRAAASAERLEREDLDGRPGTVSAAITFLILAALIGSGIVFWRWSASRYGRGVRLALVGVLGAAAAVSLMFLVDVVLPATG